MPSTRIPPTNALAAYGTLRPGESNHWVVAAIDGSWHPGTVQGWTFTIGWGDAEGYPGFVADPRGQAIPVCVLVSDDLADHLAAIDAFEGVGYRRERIDVTLSDGTSLEAWIYITVTDNDDTDDTPRGRKTRR